MSQHSPSPTAPGPNGTLPPGQPPEPHDDPPSPDSLTIQTDPDTLVLLLRAERLTAWAKLLDTSLLRDPSPPSPARSLELSLPVLEIAAAILFAERAHPGAPLVGSGSGVSLEEYIQPGGADPCPNE